MVFSLGLIFPHCWVKTNARYIMMPLLSMSSRSCSLESFQGLLSSAVGFFLSHTCWSVLRWVFEGILCTSPESSLPVTLSSLMLCSANSSHFGLSDFQLLNTGRLQGPTWVPPACIDAWKFSSGSMLGDCRFHLGHFPSLKGHYPLLPMSSVLNWHSYWMWV